MTTDLAADVNAVQQIDAVPKILDAVARLSGMGFIAVARVTSDCWVCCAVRDAIDFGLAAGGELQVETTICNEIREHGSAVVINDVQADGAFCNHPTPAMYGFRSYISVPIKLSDGTFWGTLCAIDPNAHDLNRTEVVSTFELFGELIAVQLDLQQRFQQGQEDLRTSEANLRSSKADLRRSEESRLDAEENLKTSRADLLDERKTSELREQFIGVLGHDLRNPLASIEAGLRILSKNLNTELAPQIITELHRPVLRMAGIVDNVMDFARGRLGGGLTINPDAKLPLTPVIEQVVNEIRVVWPDVQIEADIDIVEPVRCDRGKIGQLFSNLLGNALTYGDKGKSIHVSAKTFKDAFELTVTNYGPPIPEKAMEHLFRPYTRGERPSQQGLGLGLYIASQIAGAHDGELSATSTNDQTTFTLVMPLRR